MLTPFHQPPGHIRGSLVLRGVTGLLVLGLLGGAPRVAHADEAACIAASEQEISLHKDKKFRAALDQLALCSAATCPPDISGECARRIQALNAAMPTLVLAATDPAGNDLVGVTVTLDGAPLPDALGGRAVPVDPGSHTLHFEAAGKPPVDKTIVAREGEKDRRVAVVIGASANAATAAPQASPAEQASTWSTQKTLALVAGGVGLVGIGLGAGFGAAALSDWSTEQNDCKSKQSCTNPSGAESAHSSVETAGAVSTAGFIVGGVGLAAGAVLWFTAPRNPEKGAPPASGTATLRVLPLVGPRAEGLGLWGRF
jgi:hypothetical protein